MSVRFVTTSLNSGMGSDFDSATASWDHFELNFTAIGTNATIRLTDNTEDNIDCINVDDVSVRLFAHTPTPTLTPAPTVSPLPTAVPSVSLVPSSLVPTPAPTPNLALSLDHELCFDSCVLQDNVGGMHATLMNGATCTPGEGVVLDGVDDYVNLAGQLLGGPMTIA